MTAHIKALPRLFDELNSSHLTVHANTDGALAVGFAMVNASPTFVSPDLNKWYSAHPPRVSDHRQPYWAERAVAKLDEIPRRTSRAHDGYDAFGIVVVDMANDGTPVRWSTTARSPPGGCLSLRPDAPAPGPPLRHQLRCPVLAVDERQVAADGMLVELTGGPGGEC